MKNREPSAPKAIPPLSRRVGALLAATLASGVALFTLDLLWLGIVARDLYDDALGPLRRSSVNWPAALLFYAMYVGVVVAYATRARTPARALGRGAALGFVAYATYELTNWAVIAGWPALLVPVDIAWGVTLTSLAALAGERARKLSLRDMR